jgi:hypothetical protein
MSLLAFNFSVTLDCSECLLRFTYAELRAAVKKFVKYGKRTLVFDTQALKFEKKCDCVFASQ